MLFFRACVSYSLIICTIIDSNPQNNRDRIKAIAAAKVIRIAQRITDPSLVQDIIRSYLELIPVNEIAQRLSEENPELFCDDPISFIAGAVRTKLREALDESQRKPIEFHHRSNHGKDVRNSKRGVHGFNETERVENARNAGRESAKRALERGDGIFALSAEKKTIYGQKGGRASHLARGHVPWAIEGCEASNGESELDFCIALSTDPEYSITQGGNLGSINAQKIAEKLNAVFHNGSAIRTARHVTVRLSKMKAKQGKQK